MTPKSSKADPLHIHVLETQNGKEIFRKAVGGIEMVPKKGLAHVGFLLLRNIAGGREHHLGAVTMWGRDWAQRAAALGGGGC